MSETEATTANLSAVTVAATVVPSSEADDVLINSDSGDAVAPTISITDILAAEKSKQTALSDAASPSPPAPVSDGNGASTTNASSAEPSNGSSVQTAASNAPCDVNNSGSTNKPNSTNAEDPSVNITNSINMNNEEEKDQLGTLPSPMSVFVLQPAAASSSSDNLAPSSTTNTLAGSESSSGLLTTKTELQMVKRCPSGIVRMTGKKKAQDHHYPPQLVMQSTPTNRAASETAHVLSPSPVAVKSSSSYALYSRPHESPIHAGSNRHKSNKSAERLSALNVFTLGETEEHHHHPHNPRGRRNSFSRKTTVKFTHEITAVCVFDMVSYNTHGQTMGLRKGTLVECDDPKLTDEVLQEEQYFCFCLPMPNYKSSDLIKVHVWTSHGYDGYVPASVLKALPAEQQKEVPIPDEYLHGVSADREVSSESLAVPTSQ